MAKLAWCQQYQHMMMQKTSPYSLTLVAVWFYVLGTNGQRQTVARKLVNYSTLPILHPCGKWPSLTFYLRKSDSFLIDS